MKQRALNCCEDHVSFFYPSNLYLLTIPFPVSLWQNFIFFPKKIQKQIISSDVKEFNIFLLNFILFSLCTSFSTDLSYKTLVQRHTIRTVEKHNFPIRDTRAFPLLFIIHRRHIHKVSTSVWLLLPSFSKIRRVCLLPTFRVSYMQQKRKAVRKRRYQQLNQYYYFMYENKACMWSRYRNKMQISATCGKAFFVCVLLVKRGKYMEMVERLWSELSVRTFRKFVYGLLLTGVVLFRVSRYIYGTYLPKEFMQKREIALNLFVKGWK